MTVNTMPNAVTYEPALLSAEEARQLRKVARPYASLTFELAGTTATLTPSAGALTDASISSWSVQHLRWSGADCALCLPDELVAHIVTRIQPVLDATTLADDALALILEHAATSLLDTLEEKGLPTPVFGDCRLGAMNDPQASFGAVLSMDGRRWPVRLKAPEDFVEDLSAKLPLSAGKIVKNLKIPVSLRVGWTRLTCADVASLEIGDGIVIESSDLASQSLIAVVGERFARHVNVRPTGLVLSGRLLTPVHENLRSYLMAVEPSDKEGAAPAGSLSDLPINIIFELGRVEMSLTQLEKAGEGYVFDLARQPNRSVDILVNGRRMGAGEIVKIGETLGVKITDLSGE